MIATFGRTTKLQHAIGAALLVLTLSSTTEATPLDVTLDPYPVLLAGYLQISYTAPTGDFVATGWTVSLDKGSGQTDYFDTFELRAKINSAGTASSGSLSIGSAGSLLKSTSLLQFGFNKVSGGALEFLFGSPTGSLVVDHTFPDKPVDVMFTGLTSAFPGSWGSSWSSNYNATAEVRSDPPAVPEPSTLLLLLAGIGGVAGRRRFRPVVS